LTVFCHVAHIFFGDLPEALIEMIRTIEVHQGIDVKPLDNGKFPAFLE